MWRAESNRDRIRFVFCDHGRSLRLPMGGSFNRHPHFGQVGRSPAPAPGQRLPILRPGGIGASASSRALRRASQRRRSTQSERDPAGWRPFGEAGRRRQGHGAPGGQRNGGPAEVEAASGNRRASTGCSCLPAAIGGSFFPSSSASAGPWRSRLSWPHDLAAQPVQVRRRKPSSPPGGPGRGDSGHGPHGGGNRGEGRPCRGRHPSWPSRQRQDRAPRRDRGPPGAGRRPGRAGDGPRGTGVVAGTGERPGPGRRLAWSAAPPVGAGGRGRALAPLFAGGDNRASRAEVSDTLAACCERRGDGLDARQARRELVARGVVWARDGRYEPGLPPLLAHVAECAA